MARAPSVSFEKADLAPSPASVRPDVAGIVGFAPEGPVGQPVALDSFTQFETVFGAAREDLHLGWCARGFFENGGRRAWICRAAAPEARAAEVIIADTSGPAFRVEAASPGIWGNSLTVTVTEATGVETLTAGPVIEGRAVSVMETTAFLPGDLLRITQPGGFSALLVINSVDHVEGQIAWAAGDPADATITDARLVGFDPAKPLLLTRLRYNLSVSRRGVFAAAYQDVGIVPGGPRFIADLLDGLPGPLRAVDLHNPHQPGPVAALVLPREVLPLSAGHDGLANVRTGDILSALNAFNPVDEPAIFLIPDLHEPPPPTQSQQVPPEPHNPCLDCPPPAPAPAFTPDPLPETPPGFDADQIARAQHALLDWCAARPNSFALLDMPRSLATTDAESQRVLAWQRRFDNAHGALYHPWIQVPIAGRTETARVTPAAGHIAGQMAATDLAFGVHHAPANRRLAWAQGATLAIAPPNHGLLNEAGVNLIRATSGRGLRVMGARTLSVDPTWRFVPVRRLMSMIGHALALSSRWAIFEPNDHATRAKLTSVYIAFLTAIWRRGGLAGDEPAQAFFVRSEPPENEAATGRLTMIVGVAPLDPLEFIIFRIGREEGSVNVETSSAGRIQGAA